MSTSDYMNIRYFWT